MDGTAIDLVARAFRILAVVLTAGGLFLIFLDSTAPAEPSRLRRRMGVLWRTIATTPLVGVPGLAVAATMGALDRFVVYWFEQSERNVVTAGTFTLIVFIAIPIASFLNWFRGGSPALLMILVACLAGTIALAVASELKMPPLIARILSVLLFVGIFLFVPIYVLISLTDRTLGMATGHSALVSVLLMPLLYIACHSVVLLAVATGAAPVTSLQATAPRRIMTLFLAVLPFAYLATFVAMLVWHLLEPAAPIPSNWRSLLMTAGSAALAAALAGYIATPRPRMRVSLSWVVGRLGLCLALAAALAVAIKLMGGWSFSRPFVLSALPLVAPALLCATIVLAVSSKAILAAFQALPGGGAMIERPYRVAGVLVLVIAATTGWAFAAL